MPTSRVPDAIDALTSLFTTAVGTSATVYDGPVVTGEVPDVAVYVGYDGDPEGDFTAAENWTTEWAGLGARSQEELFTVVCAVIVMVGEDGVKAARDRAFATFGLITTVLRTPKENVNLGLAEVWARVADGQFLQEPNPAGLRVRIPFGVAVKARI